MAEQAEEGIMNAPKKPEHIVTMIVSDRAGNPLMKLRGPASEVLTVARDQNGNMVGLQVMLKATDPQLQKLAKWAKG